MLPGAQLRRASPEVGQGAREQLVATGPEQVAQASMFTVENPWHESVILKNNL